MTDPKWDPAQGEAPKPDNITESMEHSQKKDLAWQHSERPNKQLKQEMQGNPGGGPAVSINLDLQDLSNTGPPNRQHTPADMMPLAYLQWRSARAVFI